MELKNYLYMAFGIMAFVMGRNVATRRRPVGPATFTLLVIPIIGLTVLFSLDIYNFVQSRRNEGGFDSGRRRPRPRPKRRRPDSRPSGRADADSN